MEKNAKSTSTQKYQLDALRQRVLDFELELEEKIKSLTECEIDILNTSKLRKQWLESTTHSSAVDTESLLKKLELYRARAEVFTVQMILENAKMDAFHESQTLTYLVAATKPYDDGETAERRKHSLDALVRDNIEELKDAIKQSAASRSKIATGVYELIREVERLKLEHEAQNTHSINELRRRMNQYTAQLQECAAESRKKNREITGDYLVLRHNARVAKEILMRSQSEASLIRQALQDRLQRVKLEADEQRARVEESCELELSAYVEQIQSELLTKEGELEELRSVRQENLDTEKKQLSDCMSTYATYMTKYSDLQMKRRDDIRRIGGELQELRDLVTSLESRLLTVSDADVSSEPASASVSVSASDYDTRGESKDQAAFRFASNNSAYSPRAVSVEAGCRATIEALESRLRDLQFRKRNGEPKRSSLQ